MLTDWHFLLHIKALRNRFAETNARFAARPSFLLASRWGVMAGECFARFGSNRSGGGCDGSGGDDSWWHGRRTSPRSFRRTSNGIGGCLIVGTVFPVAPAACDQKIQNRRPALTGQPAGGY